MLCCLAASLFLAHFDEVGRSYDATVYEAMRLELVSAVHSELYGLYVNQLHNLEDAAQRVCVSMLDVRRCGCEESQGRDRAGADAGWRGSIGRDPTGQAQGRARADGCRGQVGQVGGARGVPGGGALLDVGRDRVAVPGDRRCAREGAGRRDRRTPKVGAGQTRRAARGLWCWASATYVPPPKSDSYSP